MITFSQFNKKFAQLFVIIVTLAFLLIPVAPINAATAKKTDYTGAIVKKTAEKLTLKPGESIEYTLSVKNTGKATWTNTGAKYISIYTYFPKYRSSVFYDKSWFKKVQPATMNERTIKPGQIGTLTFKLTAPTKVGSYEEGFYVASENFTWIPGTQLKIPITVANEVVKNIESKPVTPAVVTTPTPVSSNGLSALVLIKSFQDRITLSGGESGKIKLGLKNTGSVVWQTRVLRTRSLSIADSSTQLVSFADESWPNEQEAIRIREPISPGNIAYFEFSFLAPEKRGDYTLPLKLIIDDKDVPGATIDIPVTVTEDAPQLPSANVPAISGLAEPMMRVGLWNVPGGVTMLNSSSFAVVNSSGTTLTTIPAGAIITAGYNRENNLAVISTPNGQFTSPVPVRFVPTDPNGLFQIPNFEGWTATAYVNQFRGTLELNYYQPNKNVWLIEELPLEQYLRGLAETSNDSNHEFQKTLIVAARNYAYYVHAIGGKYALFDVQTGAADQVYRAYGSETIRPNLVKAVEETRGQVVTYANDVVVTPYFSRSDGRTRGWEEVWCCKVKPWLKSVPTPHDVGKSLWGHGVGMSASDALGWANDGKPFDWILKYFYTGVELKKIY